MNDSPIYGLSIKQALHNISFNSELLGYYDLCTTDSTLLSEICSKIAVRPHPQMASPDI